MMWKSDKKNFLHVNIKRNNLVHDECKVLIICKNCYFISLVALFISNFCKYSFVNSCFYCISKVQFYFNNDTKYMPKYI